MQRLGYHMATFDRGAAQKLGVGGYCVQDLQGRVVLCRGRWYGSSHDTNNEAEC